MPNIFGKKYDFFFWFLTVLILTLYNLTPPVGGFDVPYYFLAGEHFWNGQIDCLRTPVYPLLLKLSNVLFGERGGIAGVIILQSIVYLISVASVRNICIIVIKSDVIRELVSLLYIVCVAPGWCNELLTESLSISGCAIIVDMLFRYIQAPTYRLSIVISLMTLVLVFLRPNFIFLFAILPFIWGVLWIRRDKRALQFFSLLLTIICVFSYFGYCKAYEKEYGVFASSLSLVCDTYSLKRSNVWNEEKVSNQEAKIILNEIGKDNNYASLYNTINQNHKYLPLIAQGCNEMKKGSEKILLQHKIKVSVSSFDKRFDASINTHTPLSSVLFFISLFLALPLSFFYCVVLISIITLFVYFLFKRTIPLLASVLILFINAQCAGILLFASDAHERLLLPVYPIFLILIGIGIEKCFKILKTDI